MTKYEALFNASKDFKEVIPSVESLMSEYRDIANFSNWLSQNKSTATGEDIKLAAKASKPIEDLLLEKLWNNVFYQATVQANESLKNSLIEIIKANVLVKAFSISDKDKDEVIVARANAHLVLPSLLFNEDGVENDGKTPLAIDTMKLEPMIPNRLMVNKRNTTQALVELNQFKILNQDIKDLQKEYDESNNKYYTDSKKQYDKEVASIYRRYNEELETNRSKFCDSRPTVMEYNPEDPCQQPPSIPMPEIPDFKFTPEKELSEDRLRDRLDPISYQALMQVVDYKESSAMPFGARSLRKGTVQQRLDTIGTFNNLESYVNASIQKSNTLLTSNVTPYTNPLKSIGGVLVPVQNYVNDEVFKYSACVEIKNLERSLTITMRLPDSSWEAATVKVLLKQGTSSSEYYLNNPIMERIGNELTLYNIQGDPASSPTDSTLATIALEILFSNGCTKSVSEISLNILRCYRSFLIGDCNSGSVEVPPFVPKGFGVRLLGIADYKKVEQTVQCYVEGEVSNIENIMAREYREKSTRRLRRTEETVTQTNEEETEQLTDTINTDRFEMQTEIDKILQQNKSNNAYVNTGYSNSGFRIDGGIALASNTAVEDSIRQSVTQAKELTFQAQDRVISKIKKERVQRVIDEFEENNKHGFDNRKGDKHVVGVYRWVDKLYKNQVYNYGKRMMFEFMVPEPGRLHILAMKDAQETNQVIIEKPIDPRTAMTNAIKTAFEIDTEKARYWAAHYNAEIPVLKDETITISGAYGDSSGKGNIFKDSHNSGGNSYSLEIPEDYKTTGYSGCFSYVFVPTSTESTRGWISIGGNIISSDSNDPIADLTVSFRETGFFVERSLDIAFVGNDIGGMAVSITVDCKLKNEVKERWKQECFEIIMEAYYEELKKYNAKIEAEQNKAVEIKRTNPGFYRQIENTVLRKNCISYLIRNTDMGKSFTSGDSIDSFYIHQNKQLDEYASLVKFMEQAFEWDLISYNFYPFYWADKGHWSDLYSYDESDDPIFRSFMQSGMARVVATVRPGFEEAVQLYMSTGKIWNGGEVPVIGDELYISLIDEIRQVETVKEGKAWLTRVPTSLTILQAKSAGLEVEKALPCNCDDIDDFEDPSLVPCSDNFVLNDNLIGGDTGPEPDPVNG